MTEPKHSIKSQNMLGEGVVWDGREGVALWIDIEGSKFWRWRPGSEAQSFSLVERPGSFALTEKPGMYLGAFENGFARFVPGSDVFQMLAPVTRETPHLRMNDGRVDRHGTFWAGSMAEKEGNPFGSLWRYDGNGKANAFLHNIRIPNSLCWNRDGSVMYFADSPRNMIWAYAFDPETGPVGAPGILATTPSGIYPDGSCIDAEDHVWNAQWGGGEIVRYRPDGSVERRLKLPVSQPSCVAFGGENLDLLFVTSARVGLSEEQLAAEPLAGSLLVYDVGVRGLPEEICRTVLE